MDERRQCRTAIVKLGGSGGITELGLDVEYIDELWTALAQVLLSFDRIIWVIGGGRPARAAQEHVKADYLAQNNVESLTELNTDQLEELTALQHEIGIQVTQSHAAALRDRIKTLLAGEPNSLVNRHRVAETIPTSPKQAQDLVLGDIAADEAATIFVSGGTEIHQSTDAVAIQFLEFQRQWYGEQKRQGLLDYCSIHLAILSIIAKMPLTEEDIPSMLYTDDPNRVADAQPILSAPVETLIQENILSVETDELHHSPGSKAPLDRRAVRFLREFFQKETMLNKLGINVLDTQMRVLFTGSRSFAALRQYLQSDGNEVEMPLIANATILHGDTTAEVIYQ